MSLNTVNIHALVYLNVGSLNEPGEHDEIVEEIMVSSEGPVKVGTPNTAGGRRGMMFEYTC